MLDSFTQLAGTLAVEDVGAAARNLSTISGLGLPDDLFDIFVEQLRELLPKSMDADRVLVDLLRFLESARSPQAWLALFEREPPALATLVQLFSMSRYVADQLIADPESFDLLRLTEGKPVDPQALQDEILADVEAVGDAKSVMRVLRDYRHRETLRIAYGDFIEAQPIDVVTGQISELCEAILMAALTAAKRELASRGEIPRLADGTPLGFAVLALGKLGGGELNYSSDIDLVFVYESFPVSGPRGREAMSEAAVDEYFQRLGQILLRYLGESTTQGIAYRVDMRLRPHGNQGPLVVGYDQALHYYDSLGRTWERQAFIKARVVAGDRKLGATLLAQLEPWIYRRYLMRADIAGIAALKRRLEQRAAQASPDVLNVKTGHGGIRDVEYVVQFLQLLHGGEEPSVRCPNTLDALRRLEAAGCITADERNLLDENYCYLRQLEHFLQIMVDRRVHTLPAEPAELEAFVQRLRVGDSVLEPAQRVARFREELSRRTQQNRKILEHLLHGAFEASSDATPEADLVLDPEPQAASIAEVLGKYGFEQPQFAYRHLQELTVESIPFLSTRRCRHFLSAIAPKLLASIARTPQPDATLISLANVSDSIGGKAVLWELFSSNPATMELCVRLCATSPYLASILTSNPGMIDELLDSLMLDALPGHDELSTELDELCRGADDISPILQSFKNSMHLRVGVRNLLGKDSISQTHAVLSDIAEVCLSQVIQHEFHRLVRHLGIPMRNVATEVELSGGEIHHELALEPAELVVLAVGKLGGREPNYHSDVDLIFLFDSDGFTKSLVPDRRFKATTNRHFFNQLCQRVIHAVTSVGSSGRLYDIDLRLRPLGRSGELAIAIEDLHHYFDERGGQIWERQALCKARPIWGSPAVQASAMQCVADITQHYAWNAASAQAILEHRLQLEQNASQRNLKRGVGGTMDTEFAVQLLQRAHAAAHPAVVVPGTLSAIEQLGLAGVIDEQIARRMSDNYEFLRRVEAGIRLMNMSARHELPSSTEELRRLAFLLSPPDGPQFDAETLVADCQRVQASSREVMDALFARYLPAQEESGEFIAQ